MPACQRTAVLFESTEAEICKCGSASRGRGNVSRPRFFCQRQKKGFLDSQRKSALRLAGSTDESFRRPKLELSVRYASLTLPLCMSEPHRVFDLAPAAAPRRAAMQATAWWLGRKKTDASAAAALGAGQFKFRTPETGECTHVCSGFFFWGIQSPFSSLTRQRRKWEFGNVSPVPAKRTAHPSPAAAGRFHKRFGS